MPENTYTLTNVAHLEGTRARSYRVPRILKGFTLIELLVVISIIAILSAMLLPAIGMIRFSAKGMVCLNRQKQTAIGIFTYANDNDNEMPYVKIDQPHYYQGKQLNSMPGITCETSVNGMIYPYVESMRIALCPSDYVGNAGAYEPTWGGHMLPCPDPVNCRGRSNSYGPWTGNDTFAIGANTNIMDSTHGCLISQYVSRMKQSYHSQSVPVPVNRFTGRTATGALPPSWCYNDVWGSTILSEMWAGTHKNGSRRGSTLVNIDGAGTFRTFNDGVHLVAPFRQISRYEED